MSGQILIHAGHTCRLLRNICSSERRGGFSGVLGELSSTSSKSDCCRNNMSLTIQTKHMCLLWHLVYKDTSVFLSDPHSWSDFSLSARCLKGHLSKLTVLQLLRIHYATISKSHKPAADNLGQTLSFVIFLHCVSHQTWKSSVKLELPRLSTHLTNKCLSPLNWTFFLVVCHCDY